MLMLSFTAVACSRISASARALWPRSSASDDGVMLAVRVMQHVVHLLEIRFVERERLRAGERHAVVALQRSDEQRAAGLLEDERVEARVHVGVASLVALLDLALHEERVAIFETGAQLANESLRGATLGHTACSQPFEHGAQIDGVDDVRGVKPRTT